MQLKKKLIVASLLIALIASLLLGQPEGLLAADPIDNWVDIRQESSTSYLVEIAVKILPAMEEARDDSCPWGLP